VSQIQKYPNGVDEDLCQRVDYYYDSNPFDSSYSLNVAGRVAAVRYWGRLCDPATGANSYIEMYSYTSYGAMTKKKLRLTRMLRITGGLIPSYAARIADLETTAGYDAEGRLETVQYPAGGPLYKYSFDSMGMPSKLRDETNAVDVVGAVTYGLAGEMLTFGGSESRSYNVNGQMTTLNLPGRTINYNFPAAGANNGKVASIVDSGETIAYQYDSLQRLISATGSLGWSQSYTASET
jgi:YD repeat-containing protein